MGRGFFPLDEELGLLPGRLSPWLWQSVVRLGTWLPFEQTPEALDWFAQVAVGEETARRLTEQAGAAPGRLQEDEVVRLERAMPMPPAGPAVQQVRVDGAFVPLVHGEWAEVKTLVVGTVHGGTDRHGQPQVHAQDLSYFSRLMEAQGLGRLALGELHRRGTATAGVVCAVQDGADWVQGFVDLHRPDAVRILDFAHAAEHLGAAARAVWGAGSAAVSEWLGMQLHELKDGDPATVMAALRRLPVQLAGNSQEAVRVRDAVLGYLEVRWEQIQYAQFRAQGYPIGSGMVESANKLVVEARLKGSGMHWARANVNPMLALRNVACNDRWGEAWPRISGALQHQTAQEGGAAAATAPGPASHAFCPTRGTDAGARCAAAADRSDNSAAGRAAQAGGQRTSHGGAPLEAPVLVPVPTPYLYPCKIVGHTLTGTTPVKRDWGGG